MSDSSPIFIGGAGRSGTTLVVDMIGLHPRISPIYETDFVIQLIDLLFTGKQLPLQKFVASLTHCMDEWTRPLPLRPHNKREHERYHHGPHHILFDRSFALDRTITFASALKRGEVEAGFRDFLTALFAEHCRLDGKPRWANKTPAYVHHLPLLQKLFPAMRFVHCIRDGRDVACSVMTRPWGPKTVPEAATWWATKVQDGVTFAEQNPDQCLEVRFEDFLLEPRKTLDRVFCWLGEPACSDEILRHYQDGVVRLEPDRIGEWDRRFSPTDREEFDEVAGQLLDHFGYRCTRG